MKRFPAILLGLAAALAAAQAQALDQVRFGTNWVAEAEHGGFYQALADGTYKTVSYTHLTLPTILRV